MATHLRGASAERGALVTLKSPPAPTLTPQPSIAAPVSDCRGEPLFVSTASGSVEATSASKTPAPKRLSHDLETGGNGGMAGGPSLVESSGKGKDKGKKHGQRQRQGQGQALLNHGEDKPAQSLHFWSCYNFSYDSVPWIMSVVHYGASHTCDGRSRILIVSTQSCCDRAPYLSGSLAQVAFTIMARCQCRGAQPRKRRRCRDCGRLISPGCAAGCCRINGGSEAGWCWCVDCPEARPAPPVEPEPEPCRERSRHRSRSRSRNRL